MYLNVIFYEIFWSKKGDKDQKSIQSSTTPDPGYHMGESAKNTIKHHKQEPRGQPFPSSWPQWQQWTDVKARQTQDINNTNDPQKEYRLGTVSKNIILDGLSWFHGANITLS